MRRKDGCMASWIEISPENCKGCGYCIKACPTAQIRFSGKFNTSGYNHAEPLNDNCIGCGFCFYTCPEPNAIRVHRLPKQNGGQQHG